jgi:ankyrin repeat protein
MRLLLAPGAVDADTKDDDGRTPLWRAAREGHEAVVRLLLATGAVDADAKRRFRRNTAVGGGGMGGVKWYLVIYTWHYQGCIV